MPTAGLMRSWAAALAPRKRVGNLRVVISVEFGYEELALDGGRAEGIEGGHGCPS